VVDAAGARAAVAGCAAAFLLLALVASRPIRRSSA